jgi:serine/threonine protein kinase
MGEVYRARDKGLDHGVALKVSKTEFSDRFEREARLVAALNGWAPVFSTNVSEIALCQEIVGIVLIRSMTSGHPGDQEPEAVLLSPRWTLLSNWLRFVN